jgi:N-acetylneuraminic acid mutarotase
MQTRILILLFMLSSVSKAQVGMWTWVNGSDTINPNGRYGVQGVPDPLNTPPSVYEPCEFTDNQGFFWTFGGFVNRQYPHNGNSNNLWRYNPLTNEWTWMKGPGVEEDYGHYGTRGISSTLNLPACRGWGTPSWSDNSGNLWIYSGSIGYDDLWRYNIALNEWTWMKGDTTPTPYNQIAARYGAYQVPDSSNTPGTRNEVATTWTDNNGNLWLFGGGSYNDTTNTILHYNDLWKYDVSLNQWVWMKGPNHANDAGHYGTKSVESPLNLPPSRDAYAKWKDPEGNFYFMGGFYIDLNGSCTYQGFNDVWKYRVATNNWIWLGGSSTYNQQGTQTAVCETDSNNIPENYWENRAVCFDGCGNVFLFGGIGAACNTYSPVKNELWHYNTYTNEWTVINPWTGTNFGIKGLTTSSNMPPSTFGSLAWYRDKSVWVFAGSRSGNNESHNCMWRYDLDTSCLPKLCPLPTDVYALESDNDFKLLPNPAVTELFIQTKLYVEQVNIYDISGSLVSQTKLPQSKSIDISQLAPGVYIAEIKTKGASVRRRWAKM